MLILICDAFDPSLPQRLARFGEVTDDHGRLAEADVALVRSKTKCTAEWIAAAPKLRLIIRGGVGLDNVDRQAAQTRDITVRNTPRGRAIMDDLCARYAPEMWARSNPGTNTWRWDGRWAGAAFEQGQINAYFAEPRNAGDLGIVPAHEWNNDTRYTHSPESASRFVSHLFSCKKSVHEFERQYEVALGLPRPLVSMLLS